MRIIDVSSYNNNCGLYALALAVSLEINKRRSYNPVGGAPLFLKLIQEHTVSSKSQHVDLDRLGRNLRYLLCDALRNNSKFKHAYIHSFKFACLNPDIEPESEIASLIDSNKDFFISSIRDELDSLNLQDVAISNFKDVVSIKQIASCKEILTEAINNPSFADSYIESYLQNYYQNPNIVSLHECCKLLCLAWAEITIESEVTQNIKVFIENWFFATALKILNECDVADFSNVLVNLGECRRYLDGSNDALYNAKEIYVQLQVSENWQTIYANYVEYVGTNPVMLSIDELSILAYTWNVRLNVLTPNRRQYTNLRLDEPDIDVYLINPNNIHWQLVADYVGLEIYTDLFHSPQQLPNSHNSNVVEETESIIKEAGSVIEEAESITEEAGSVIEEAGSVIEEVGAVIEETDSIIEDAESITEEIEHIQSAANSPGFSYKHRDMLNILYSRLMDVEIAKPWYILGPVDNFDDMGFKKILMDSLENTKIAKNGRYLIIPCFFFDSWFGVFIKIDDNNKAYQAFFYDSRKNEFPSPYDSLCLQLRDVFPSLRLQSSSCIKQDNIDSSFHFTVLNLVEAAAGQIVPTTDMLNASYLRSVQIHRSEYVDTLKAKQKFAAKRLPVTNNNSHSEVVQYRDAAFKTLLLLNHLFKELSTPQTERPNYCEIRDCIANNYTTIRDDKCLLKLQFTPSESMAEKTSHAVVPKDVRNQIEIQQGLTDFSILAKPVGYEPRTPLLLGAGAGSMTATAAVIADVAAAVEIGAIILNPVFFVPAVLIVSGGAASTILSTSLSNRNKKIAMAFAEYSQAIDNDNRNEIARIMDKLSGELYGNGTETTNIISRNLRHVSSSYNQLAFTYLFLGITSAMNANIKAYDILYLAFRYACSTRYFSYANSLENIGYRRLALLWMLHILTPNTPGNPENISEEQQAILRAKYLQTLKNENPNIESEIHEYIRATIRLSLNYIRHDSDLDKFNIQLKKIINFGPTHALRYFGPYGRIGELVLTFIQALCMKETASDREMPKFDELISHLDLQDIENSTELQSIIVQEIQNYVKIHLDENAAECDISTIEKDDDQLTKARRRNNQQRHGI